MHASILQFGPKCPARIPFFAEVIAGGRTTIPEEIRKIFEVRDGDHVFCRMRVVRKEGATVKSKQTKGI